MGPWDAVLFATCGLSLVVLSSALLRKARKQLRHAGAALRSLRAKLGSWVRPSDDEVGAIVHSKMMEKKLDSFRRVSNIICLILSPFTANIMVNIATERTRGYSQMQDATHIIIQLLTAVTMLMPKLISTKNLDVYYLIFMVASLFYSNPYATYAIMVVPTIIGTNGMVLALALAGPVPGRAPLLFTMNTAFALCSASTLWLQGSNISPQASFLAITQVLVIMLVTCHSSFSEGGYRAIVEQSLRFQESKELQLAVVALLRSLCEVVVEIDSQSMILSPASDLGSFLLRGPSRDLKGVPLVDLISDQDDKKTFMQRLANPTMMTLGLAENMQVTMRDADGRHLRLELMWFQFRRLDGGDRYMVGIREFSDAQLSVVQSISGEAQNGSIRQTDQAGDHPVHPILQMPSPDTTTLIVPENTFMVPEMHSVNSGSVDDVDATIIVDCSQKTYIIKSVSSEFSVRIGRLPTEEPLGNHIANGKAFTSWVQMCVNAMRYQQNPPSDQYVVFLMPQGKMRAMCRIVPDFKDLEQDSEPDFDIDPERVSLSFYKIKKMREDPGRSIGQASVGLRGGVLANHQSV